MSDVPLVDTDIIMRLLTGDDPVKQLASRELFEQVEAGDLTVRAPDTVIADAVYVLASRVTYRRSRTEVRALLTPLARLPHFKLRNRRQVLRALIIYAETNLDFGDAMLVAAAERSRSGLLYSYDKDFDRVPGVTRLEP